jgi:protein TonB
MNQQTILKSNLLDIIFENRNKDYGAYVLRKSYNSRLSIAVFSAVGLVVIFSLLLSRNSISIDIPVPSKIYMPDTKISEIFKPTPPPSANKREAVQHTTIQKRQKADGPPLIVSSDKINNIPATPIDFQPSFAQTSLSEVNFTPGISESIKSGPGGDGIKTKSPEPDKTLPVMTAEIMPQYPGGIAALLAFLKKNLQSPGDIEAGEEVSVNIQFVVNYNGQPESFRVIKSGGELFDNEVLRVLKKMPSWIPGKSEGKNVSVYYTVPVKFTSEY